jgi:hypothetical protein
MELISMSHGNDEKCLGFKIWKTILNVLIGATNITIQINRWSAAIWFDKAFSFYCYDGTEWQILGSQSVIERFRDIDKTLFRRRNF